MSVADVHLIDNGDNVVYATIVGEIDDAELVRLREIDGQRVVINAAGITFAGSSFLTWLIQTRDRGAGLIIRHPSAVLVRLLELTGMTDEFTVER